MVFQINRLLLEETILVQKEAFSFLDYYLYYDRN